MTLLKAVSATAAIAAGMFFGGGFASATPGDGCYGNTYFDPNRWHCEPINPAPAPPPPPPGPGQWGVPPYGCYWCH
ncbi:hypothetical protein [Mycobacterium rhizamassiliense]|nr:hypothetical protein [Mycobacterium rhizamassiliense]